MSAGHFPRNCESTNLSSSRDDLSREVGRTSLAPLARVGRDPKLRLSRREPRVFAGRLRQESSVEGELRGSQGRGGLNIGRHEGLNM